MMPAAPLRRRAAATLAALGLALTAHVAQAQDLPFADPLEERLGQQQRAPVVTPQAAPDAEEPAFAPLEGLRAPEADSPTSLAGAPSSVPTGTTADVPIPAAGKDWAEGINPAIAVALLAGLALLGALAWIGLRRRKARREARFKDGTLYQVDHGSRRRRRQLDSGSMALRHRRAPLDTTENGGASARRGVSKAAAVPMAVAPLPVRETEESAAPTEEAPTPSRDDPSTWRQPDLSRLRDSIRDEWQGKPPEAEAPVATKGGGVLDMLDEWEQPAAAAKAPAPEPQPEAAPADPRAERAARRAEAARRLRALRDALDTA